MGAGWELLGGHGKIERGDLFGQYGIDEGCVPGEEPILRNNTTQGQGSRNLSGIFVMEHLRSQLKVANDLTVKKTGGD
jgi:hypothetical protein